MILNITTTHHPAQDLGFLLHKHPDRLQSFDLSVGKAYVFYPESAPDRTTVSLMLSIDPIDLVRGGRKLSGRGFTLGQYVNDRPYVASSFMSVALAKVFSTAMNGKCAKRPELVEQPIPLQVKLASLPAPKGGEPLIRKLFEPLGYTVQVAPHDLDSAHPEWGHSRYYTVDLAITATVQDLLSHLYVLIPVLDNDKHYFVSENEVEKLMTRGGRWLKEHPEKEQIVSRYLYNIKSLSRQALAELKISESDARTFNDGVAEKGKSWKPLHTKRLEAVRDQLVQRGATSVIDLGCGEGKLLKLLLRKGQFQKIVGMDVSYDELLRCKEQLNWDEMSPKRKARIELFQGSLVYRDARLAGYDAAAIVEVIEHLDEHRLRSFERVVFQYARPSVIVLTTPNREYNAVFTDDDPNRFRHDDHRFEWTRSEFTEWANQVAETHRYSVDISPIGDEHAEYGAPSQMAVFTYDA